MFLQFEIIYSIKVLFPNVLYNHFRACISYLEFYLSVFDTKMKCWSPTAEESRGLELEIFSNL